MATDGQAIPWDEVELFLAVFRARSLTGAASRLRVNQATVSRRLRALEDRIGQALFVRLPRGVTPTNVAEAMYGHAERAESAVMDCSREALTHERGIEGTVRVATLDSLATWLIAPALPKLFEAHPQLHVELVASSGIADLTRRDADLALRSVRPTSGELVTKRVAMLGHQIYCAPAADPPRDLAAQPWVALDASLGRTPLPRWQRAHLPNAQVVLHGSGLGLVAAAVAAGVGLAILPTALGKVWGLQAVPTDIPLPSAPLWLVGHASLRKVPRIEAVWRFLASVAADMDDGGGHAVT